MKTSSPVCPLVAILTLAAASCFAGPAKKLRPPAELERGPTKERQIALTFDAGGGNEDLPRLLRILDNERVTATFFLTGQWVGENPVYATSIVDGGHVIGNHTWGHKDLTKLSAPDIKQEILRADDRFVSTFGCRYFPLFRAPYGEVNPRVLQIVDQLGFRAVRWSIDTLDALEERKTSAFIEDRVLRHSDEELCGAIVLMHVGYPETCDALPVIIHNLRERGFEFVPVTTWVSRPEPVLTGASAVIEKSVSQTLITEKSKAVCHAPPLRASERQSLGAAEQVARYPKDLRPTTYQLTKP